MIEEKLGGIPDMPELPETGELDEIISEGKKAGVKIEQGPIEKFPSIFEKLSCVQSALEVKKGRYNEFGNFSYRTCSDILVAVKPLLAQYRLVMYMHDNVEVIGNQHYVRATITLVDLDTNAQHSVCALAKEYNPPTKMNEAQMSGSISSYARKYALSGMFCIDDEKDPDSQPTDDGGFEAKTIPICSVCKTAIKGIKKSDGTIVTPEQVAKGCNGMCYKCYKTALSKTRQAEWLDE